MWPVSALLALIEGASVAASGWALTGSLAVPHVWVLVSIAAMLFAGAGLLRELAGSRGDAAYGVATLSTSVGPAKAAKFAAPMLVLPFLVLPVAAATGLVRVPAHQLLDTVAVGAGCALLGARLAVILLADPEAQQQPGHSLVPRYAMLCALYFVATAITHIPYAQWGRWIRELT